MSFCWVCVNYCEYQLSICLISALTNNIPVTYGALQVSYCIVLYCIVLYCIVNVSEKKTPLDLIELTQDRIIVNRQVFDPVEFENCRR